MVALPWLEISFVVPPHNIFSICLSSQSSSPLNSSSALGVVVRGWYLQKQVPAWGDQATLSRRWNWCGAMHMSHSDRSKANLRIAGEPNRLKAEGSKKMRARRRVVQRVMLSLWDVFIHWAWQALGVHVSSLSEPMNAIILAQVGVEPKKNSLLFLSPPTQP